MWNADIAVGDTFRVLRLHWVSKHVHAHCAHDRSGTAGTRTLNSSAARQRGSRARTHTWRLVPSVGAGLRDLDSCAQGLHARVKAATFCRSERNSVKRANSVETVRTKRQTRRMRWRGSGTRTCRDPSNPRTCKAMLLFQCCSVFDYRWLIVMKDKICQYLGVTS
jgi:hypothetical protein